MSNMSYVRFENTYSDLNDCLDHIHDKLSERESKYRKWLVDLCKEILDEYDPKENVHEQENMA